MTNEVDETSAASRGSVANHSAFPNSWIPVTERLPREYDRVIGWRIPWVRAAEVWRTTSGDWLFGDCEMAGEVTHWMPLPAPPSDGK